MFKVTTCVVIHKNTLVTKTFTNGSDADIHKERKKVDSAHTRDIKILM